MSEHKELARITQNGKSEKQVCIFELFGRVYVGVTTRKSEWNGIEKDYRFHITTTKTR